MLLSDFVKSLIDVLTDCGECKVLLTAEDSSTVFTGALLHYIPFDNPVLRIEGITEETAREMDAENEEEEENEDGEDYSL